MEMFSVSFLYSDSSLGRRRVLLTVLPPLWLLLHAHARGSSACGHPALKGDAPRFCPERSSLVTRGTVF